MSNEIAFTEEYRDSTTTHRYQVIRLWEQEPTWFLENLALLPFAPLTRSDSPQGLLAQVAQKVATIEDRQQKANLASCTGLLAGLRFDKSLIRQLFREEVMRESVIYQDWCPKYPNPLRDKIFKQMEDLIDVGNLAKILPDNIERFIDWYSHLDLDAKENIEIKTYPTFPTVSVISIDKDHPSRGYIRLEPIIYKSPPEDLPSFCISISNSPNLYPVLRKRYNQLWGNSTPLI